MFNYIFTSLTQETMTLSVVLICTAVAFAMGLLIALVYMYRNTYNKSFAITLALLPLMIQIVIMLVNGNLGTSVAVLGAFSLIRFRSIAGTARDISSIFFAMAIGLACGMGFVIFAIFITLVICSLSLLLYRFNFAETKVSTYDLKIVIPETLDYEGVFDDLFEQYTQSSDLTQVRTTNLGSLFELTYVVEFKSKVSTKSFMDDIRVRNDNLNIICTRSGLNRELL